MMGGGGNTCSLVDEAASLNTDKLVLLYGGSHMHSGRHAEDASFNPDKFVLSYGVTYNMFSKRKAGRIFEHR
jgi:hypothetical protein